MFDVVETKWIDPTGSLGELVGIVLGVPYSDDLVETVTLYPPPEGAPKTDDAWEALPDGSPYLVGPQIEELPVSVRDTLAEVDDARLPDVARRWMKEELSNLGDVQEAFELVNEFVALARRAKESDQLLYCWGAVG
ncbi:hypothetical protein OUY22_18750 [Nonomuraea sp. MCN248]|uniref:DUF4259 domain-containing protein n=1 Tax=Nonomuraea corallina TaxID=2989783 RepID=A0ABT4SER6_9ACTN|nr:hypothetical protein [Nonomuraea corallina]MDA0635465.1 hypothetical protein [Nonomuraea corallina]